LANVKSTEPLEMATGVALQVFVGDSATASPAPCTDPQNPSAATCGNHLKGTGMFKIASDSPMNAQIVGKTVGDQFTGGPGKVTLEITLSATAGAPIKLDLIGARARIPAITAGKLGSDASPGIIAGGVTQA